MGNKKDILKRQREPKAAGHVLRQRYWAIKLEQSNKKTGDELLDALLHFESHATTDATTRMRDDVMNKNIL